VVQSRKRILLFTIEDTGIGISRDKIGRLFKQFSQLDGSTTREFGGLVHCTSSNTQDAAHTIQSRSCDRQPLPATSFCTLFVHRHHMPRYCHIQY
jgi:hypothetical protein